MLKQLPLILSAALLLTAIYSQPAFAADCDEANTQKEMNTCATQEYKKADRKLNKVYAKALTKTKSRTLYEGFRNGQRAWIKYRDLNCDLAADMYKGGSLESFIYYDCMERLTDDRTEEISDLFGNDR